MNIQNLIKLLRDFGVITNNRVETAFHFALVLPFIAIALVFIAVLWFFSLGDGGLDNEYVHPVDGMDPYTEYEMYKYYRDINNT